MRKHNLFILALLVMVLAIPFKAFSWGATGLDGKNFGQLQETAVFYNNSGQSLTAGLAVILDTSGTAGTTLGGYITISATADSVLAVGVTKDTCPASSSCVVVTKGPAKVYASDSTDAVTSGSAVGTTATREGYIGGGTNLGIALEAGDGTDGDEIYIWVAPTGAD